MYTAVEDGVSLFNVVAGYDPADPLTLPDKREADHLKFLNAGGLVGKRIGVLRVLVDHDDADEEIKDLVFKAVEDLKAAGAVIVDPFEIKDFMKISEAIPWCGPFRYDVGKYFQTLDKPPLLDVNEVLKTGDYAPESKSSLEFYAQRPLDISPDDWEKSCASSPNHPQRNQLLGNTIEAMDAARLDALIYPTWSNPLAHIDRADELLCRVCTHGQPDVPPAEILKRCC